MSLGAGHVWATKPSSAGFDGIECVGCGKRRNFPLSFIGRFWRPGPKRGKNFSRSVMRNPHGGRPLGTCPEVARRRAAGEAEIRATFDLFE